MCRYPFLEVKSRNLVHYATRDVRPIRPNQKGANDHRPERKRGQDHNAAFRCVEWSNHSDGRDPDHLNENLRKFLCPDQMGPDTIAHNDRGRP